MVSLAVRGDGTPEFSIIDSDKRPMLFVLRAQDVAELDRAVGNVAAYYGP